MSIRKGTSIIAGNLGQNIDDALSLTSTNPVQNKVITEELETKLGQSDITNCIIKIPQDIKLELNGGALILKSGSKFYYPNGLDGTTPIFNSFTTTSDLTLSVGGTGWTNKEHAILVLNDGTSSVGYACPDDLYSGSNPPTLSTQYACWYDTGSNIIRRTTDSGSTWTSTPYSFPICIAVNTGGNCDSISQIFNGFGYIGSTVFALPGVKGLIPDGRNADGSLKNTEFTTSSVLTIGYNTYYNNYKISLNAYGIDINVSNPVDRLEYKEKENINYNNSNNQKVNAAHIGFVSCDGTRITSLSSKTAFHALDYNDSEYIAHQAMPSSRYINLTLGASGATYTAPADGYVTLIKAATAAQQYIEMSTGQVFANMAASYNGQYLYGTIPVSKGASFQIYYTAGGSTIKFIFSYAQGAV